MHHRSGAPAAQHRFEGRAEPQCEGQPEHPEERGTGCRQAQRDTRPFCGALEGQEQHDPDRSGRGAPPLPVTLHQWFQIPVVLVVAEDPARHVEDHHDDAGAAEQSQHEQRREGGPHDTGASLLHPSQPRADQGQDQVELQVPQGDPGQLQVGPDAGALRPVQRQHGEQQADPVPRLELTEGPQRAPQHDHRHDVHPVRQKDPSIAVPDDLASGATLERRGVERAGDEEHQRHGGEERDPFERHRVVDDHPTQRDGPQGIEIDAALGTGRGPAGRGCVDRFAHGATTPRADADC